MVFLAVAAGLGGLAVTVNRWGGDDMDDARREGRAAVSACWRHGPITNRGFGYWESCEAKITWADGDLEAVSAGAVFTSADIGTAIRVGDLGMHRTERRLVRAGAPYRPWLEWLSYGIGLIALVPGFIGVMFLRVLFRSRKP